VVAAAPATAPANGDAAPAQADLLDAQGQVGVPAGAPRAPGTAPKPAQPTDLQVRKDVKDANAALAAIGTQLVFVFDDQAHHLAVKLLDIQTQKVVQQIPPAAMHATANALSGATSSGALVDTKA
jgi:uncharacterized FlaG/YvyC family protein